MLFLLLGRKPPSQPQQASSSTSNRGQTVAKGNKELDPFFAPDEEPKVFNFSLIFYFQTDLIKLMINYFCI